MQSIFNRLGFPIRKSADQFIFADPRSLSQLITSFFASESQGIPRVPFLTFFYHYRLLLGKVCFFYSDRRSLVHWFISSLVLLPMYLWSCDPLKPTTVLSVVFSFITSSNMSKNVLRWFIRLSVHLFISKNQWTIEPVNYWTPASWRITDSNRWPPACKAGALASWANPP